MNSKNRWFLVSLSDAKIQHVGEISENKKAEHSLSLYQRSDQEPAKKTQRSIRQVLIVQKDTIVLPAVLQLFLLANNFYLVGFWYIC